MAAIGGVCLVSVLAAAGGWHSVYIRWQVRQARGALREAKFEEARRCLYAAEKSAPDDAELQFLIGRLHRRAGPFDKIAVYLDRSERSGWPGVEVQHQRQLALLQTGQSQAASAYLNTVLRTGCNDELAEEIYEALARGGMATYRLGDALVALNFWLEWRPQTSRARFSRACVFEQLGRRTDAVADCQKILESAPGALEARRKLADNLFELNIVDRALHEYERCLEVSPLDADALIGVARCHMQLGRSDEAVPEFEELLSQELPSSRRAVALLQLGRLQIERRELEAGIRLLTEAVQIPPVPAEAHQALGSAYALSHRKKLAAEQFQAAKRAANKASRLAEITELLAQRPDDADLRCEAGTLYMEQGLVDDAVAWFRTALLSAPDHRETHAALSRYYRESGDRTRADHHQEMAVKSRP